jgi:hypothetical protein
MRAAAVLTTALALVLAACAAPAASVPGGPGQATNQNDCAVIAAVAKEHYRFNTTDNVPPPVWLDAAGSDWAPRCDWSQYGLSFPSTFDPNTPRGSGDRVQWVSFKRPTYSGTGALVETGILHGPLNGRGGICRVVSGFAGWTVVSCQDTWIS